jgi:two-component system OmpR family sensor kinase
MVLTVAALAGTALIVTDFVGAARLRSHLVGGLDAQLEGEARGLARITRLPYPDLQPHQLTQLLSPRTGPPFGADSRVFVYTSDGARLYASPGTGDGEPDLNGVTGPGARADRPPYTVGGTGGNWRVLVTPIADGRQYAVHALSMREVEATGNRLLLVDASVTVLVLLLIGVAATSVVRIEAALADRTASERRLRQFLADASHELRTPLTSIQGFAELYRRGGAPPGPALDEAMGRIEAEVGRMRLLVNDLLLLARLDEERPLERRPVDLLAVAADAVRDAHVRVPSRFVRLAGLDDDDETFEPATVSGDEPRIRQVVNNLVANALQHTSDDCAVVVRVGASPGRQAAPDPEARTEPLPAAVVGASLPPGRPVAIVEVADAGAGMSTAEARHAFERLYRAGPGRDRRQSGAGLGLAIVAAIVQTHGGRVELYTAPGSGARFRVLLPAGADRSPN